MGKAGKPLRKSNHRRAKAPQEAKPDLTRENARLRTELEKAKQNGRQLDETIRFEKLLLEISTRLLNLPPEQVGREIERGLRRVVGFLGGDRGSIFDLAADLSHFHLLYSYTREGIPQAPPTFLEQDFPFLTERLRQGQVIFISALEEVPHGGTRDKESLAKLGIKSLLVIPLAVGESVLGAVTFASLREERIWPGSLVQRLRLVGVIFANALARKKADIALRQAELDYRMVADFTYDWEYWANPDGTLRYVSPSCQKVTGYSPQDFRDRPSLLREILLPVDREIWDQHLRRVRQQLHPEEVQFRIRRRDGEVRWIEHACQPVRGAQGDFLGFRVCNRDATDRRQVEEAVRKKDRSLAEAQRIAHLGNWDWNIETNELAWSDEVYRIFGLQPQEFGATYNAFLESVHPDDRETVRETVNRSLADPSVPYSIEHRVVRPDGAERIVHERGEVTFDDGGRPIRMIGTVQDITERKQVEEMLRRSQEELRRLSAQLLSVQEEERKRVARELHDGIGQSLSALKFLLENRLQKLGKKFLPADLQPLESIVPMLQNAVEEVRRMQSDLRPPLLDDLGILATISWFCREFQKVYAKIKIEREMDIQENEVPNPLKTVIYRVLQEAMNNVAKHGQATQVSLSLRKIAPCIELIIRDNGVGFDLSQVFSRKNVKRGLGLSSMRERTELSGGSFSIHSAKGKGTAIHASWKGTEPAQELTGLSPKSEGQRSEST
jgi:PAS domain S-box-containing protein